MTGRLILPYPDWPEVDRQAWDALFRAGDVFEGEGRCAGWSEGSRRKRAQSYGHWLGFLARQGLLDPAVPPAARFTPETVRAFVGEAAARIAPISTVSQVADLFVLASHLDPARDWSWFKRIADRLRRQTKRWQLKPRAGIGAAEIFDWALAEIEAAEAMEREDSRMTRAVRFRDGLMIALLIALLIARPLRLRAFIGMEIGTHLARDGAGFLLSFRREDMKDRKAREFALPASLVGPMERYLDHYRPALLKGAVIDALRVSRRSGPLSRDGFQRHLRHVTGRAFGEALYPHGFRHVAATSIAEEDPAHVNTIASLLGHATLDMAEKHYNRASGVTAAASWQDMVRARRREARRQKGVVRNKPADDDSPGVAG